MTTEVARASKAAAAGENTADPARLPLRLTGLNAGAAFGIAEVPGATGAVVLTRVAGTAATVVNADPAPAPAPDTAGVAAILADASLPKLATRHAASGAVGATG